jgi:hypothetical protein
VVATGAGGTETIGTDGIVMTGGSWRMPEPEIGTVVCGPAGVDGVAGEPVLDAPDDEDDAAFGVRSAWTENPEVQAVMLDAKTKGTSILMTSFVCLVVSFVFIRLG